MIGLTRDAFTFEYPRVGVSCDCLLVMALDIHCPSSAGLMLNAHPVIATLDPTRDEQLQFIRG